jgi:4-carboxymuconolactone decarboxylase
VTGPNTRGWNTHDEQLLRTADELHRDATISDTTWADLAARYAPGALVEIPLIVGQYTMLSNAAGVELEPGPERLPDLPTGA